MKTKIRQDIDNFLNTKKSTPKNKIKRNSGELVEVINKKLYTEDGKQLLKENKNNKTIL